MNTVKLRGNSMMVYGTLNFESVPIIYRAGVALLDKAHTNRMVIDFSNVSTSGSAGLALLTSLLRFARKKGREISFEGLPRQLYDLVCLSQLDHILPILQSGHLENRGK